MGARVPPHAGGHRGQSAPSTPVKVLARVLEVAVAATMQARLGALDHRAYHGLWTDWVGGGEWVSGQG